MVDVGIYKNVGYYLMKLVGAVWVAVSPSSAKLSIYIPELYGWFQYDILYITGMQFSGCLVFYMQEMSVMLNAENSISWPPF